MPIVIGVRFRDSGKVYFFDPAGQSLQVGELVIVETVRGLEIGKVAQEPHHVQEEEIVGELKRVMRRPDQDDLERMQQYSARQHEVIEICAERVAAHNLPMRLVKGEYNFDGSRLTFYFTADQRIDFRALVRDLARTFRTRIELRQIGPRDEARLLGGIGPCGRPLCCATFLPDFARVSIKMAKDQDLPLNPSKISGVCGRLLCCLSYEHEQYLEIKSELPPRGAWVQTPHGPGEVMNVNIVRETVTVDVSGNYFDVTADQIAEATALVAGEARGRLDSGTAAPVTRESQADAAEGPKLDDDDLSLIEQHEVDGDLIDVAEERLPHKEEKQNTSRSQAARQDSNGHQQRRERRQRSVSTSQPPHPLSTDDLGIDDLPELHSLDEQAPATEPQRKSRRRRRRKRGGQRQGGDQPDQHTNGSAPAADSQAEQRQPQRSAKPEGQQPGAEHAQRSRSRRRRRS